MAVEGHAGLRTRTVRNIIAEGRIFSWLEHLLSRNRNTTVLDSGEKITNGSTIDKLYLLNRFYHGSVALVKESTESRPDLVAAALTEGASSTFPHSALVLSDHTDMLCESMNGADLDHIVAAADPVAKETVSRASIPSGPHQSASSSSSKRTKVPPPRAATKVARK